MSGTPLPPEAAGYLVPARRHRVESVINRSRFIATAGRASDADMARDLVAEVSREFPDATHHCWAFVAGSPGDTARIGMSDDGEPHGTAGRPMLEVLLHGPVGEVAVVVTRYFGGTKLGKGGLARAYGGAVSAVLDSLPVRREVEMEPVRITLRYPWLDAVQRLMQDLGAEVTGEAYGEEVVLEVVVPADGIERFKEGVAEVTGGGAEVVIDP